MTNITVSIDYAKKLRDAGWEQLNSYFVWMELKDGERCAARQTAAYCSLPAIAAPTAEEILRELPYKILKDARELYLSPNIRGGDGDKRIFQVGYVDDNWYSFKVEADTLANAAAAMWIYLKENDLLPTP